MKPSEETIEYIYKYIRKNVSDSFFYNKKVAIFGCNAFCKTIIDSLADAGIVVNAILDNDINKQGKKCLSIDVFSPKEYLKDNYEKVIIIYSSYWKEMEKELYEMNVDSNSILIIPYKDMRSHYRPTLLSLIRLIPSILYGFIYYRIKSSNEKKTLFVFPYNGTGDIYISCLFLTRFIDESTITNYKMIVTSENAQRVCNLFFPKDLIICTKRKNKVRLMKIWCLMGLEIKVFPASFWGWKTKRTPWVFDNKQVTFLDMFKVDTYGYDETDKPILPYINRNSDYASDLFRKKHLVKGKTVIIAPYANSTDSTITMDDWEWLAQKLIEKGFCVCTNCSDGEAPICNTIPLFFPYEEAVNVLEYAGIFVAIRSGLCDIVSDARCKMFIIYENGLRSLNYDYFSLYKMGISNAEVPIVFSNRSDFSPMLERI